MKEESHIRKHKTRARYFRSDSRNADKSRHWCKIKDRKMHTSRRTKWRSDMAHKCEELNTNFTRFRNGSHGGYRTSQVDIKFPYNNETFEEYRKMCRVYKELIQTELGALLKGLRIGFNISLWSFSYFTFNIECFDYVENNVWIELFNKINEIESIYVSNSLYLKR